MADGTPSCIKGTIRLTHPGATLLLPATCRKWNCPLCGPRKARRLRKRLARTEPSRLITLTLKPDPTRTPAELLAVANAAWSILWRRLRRKHGAKAVGYAKVVELTKKGTPHLHIIASVPFIAQTSLAAQWKELTGSYIVDIRKVDAKFGINRYLTAYLTKALDVPEGMRKWSAARGYVPPEEPPPLEPGELRPLASFCAASADALAEELLRQGWAYVGAWLVMPIATPAETSQPRAPA